MGKIDDQIHAELIKNTNQHFNLGENIVVTTEDKINLCLMKHLKSLEDRKSWLIPFGPLLAIILAFITTDFKDGLGLLKATWEAIFIILGVAFFLWSIIAGYKSIRAKTIRDIVEELKKSSIQEPK